MKIILDIREDSLYNLIIKQLENVSNITCIREKLLIADIIFKDDNDKELVLFERKSYNDLYSSLKDGRYNEQSLRLDSSELCNHNIVYLLEESYKKFKGVNTMTDNLLHSCIFSLMFYKGFSVLQTKSISHTASMIVDFAKKLQKDVNKPFYSYFNGEENNQRKIDYVETIKKEKKANITCENINIIMLSQVPDVSTTSAKAILDKYTTVSKLVDALNKDNNCIETITYTTKSEQKRKITKKTIDSIKKYLCNIEPEVIDMSKII